MDIRALESFLRVAELGSFTKAAQEMNYLQSTVSMRILQLEEELGVRLFDRVGKKIFLTPYGEELVEYANEMMRLTRQIRTIGKAEEDISVLLRVGIIESLLHPTVLEVFPVFKKRYKNIKIQIKMGQSADMKQLLKQNQLDMLYVSGGAEVDPELQLAHRRKERLCFVADISHPLAGEERVPLARLAEYPFLLTEPTGVFYRQFVALLAAHKVRFPEHSYIESIIAIMQFLTMDNSVAFLPEYAVEPQIRAGSLCELSVDVPDQYFYSQVLFSKQKTVAPYMLELVRLIRAARPEND